MFNNKSLLYNTQDELEVYDWVFEAHRITRAEKLVNILGVEWFKDKKILEMGCSSGNIGLYLKSLGADVSFCDAREQALEYVRRKDKNCSIFLLNQDTDWSLNTQYDLVIHFGLLYHLDNWERDLIKVLEHTSMVALETAVTKYDCYSEFKIKQPHYSHILHGPESGTGTLVSSKNIERVFNYSNIKYRRFDDSDINIDVDSCKYDWHEQSICNIKSDNILCWWDNPHYGGRRFWLAYK